MKVLMFGWEFPPNSTGGLGTACYGLTRALGSMGVEITLVLPESEAANVGTDFLRVVNANVRTVRIKSGIKPYMTPAEYYSMYGSRRRSSLYGSTLFEEVRRYAEMAAIIAAEEDFDIIHCHDWLTFEAGIQAKMVSGKPLVCHVHSTEFDRTGGLGMNRFVYEIERRGVEHADAVIAVSNYTRGKLLLHYGAEPAKVEVVHNAVDHSPSMAHESFEVNRHRKIVLFLGRVTLQKGPDYFVYAAKRISEVEPDALFVMAGSGDMQPFIVDKAAELGIADSVLFTGHLKGGDVDRVYRMADVYVMPSVSEPFGITALEAIKNGTPVVVSRNSGVSEIVKSCLKVDFWDINQLASKVVAVLRYKELAGCLVEDAAREINRITWEGSARKTVAVYQKLLGSKVLV